MKKFLILLCVLFPSIILSQCPNGPLELKSQAEVDAFAVDYPNCTELTHSLIVNGEDSAIVNLDALTGITLAQELFVINTDITDLTGLSNLVSVGYFSVGVNPGLNDLTGMDQLEVADQLNIYINSNMTSLNGAPNLISTTGIYLYENNALVDITELSDIQSVNLLSISGNALTNLEGLENIQTVTGDIFIANGILPNLNDLSSLSEVGGEIFLLNQTQLTDISVFSSITSVDNLIILACDSLSSLDGLQNITEIRGTLRMGFMPLLEELTIFQNLTTVGSLDFYENAALIDLTGLENLEQIEDNLYLLDNPSLSDMSSIGDLSAEGMSEVVVFGNPNLDSCDYEIICEAIFDEDIYHEISNNGSSCLTAPQVAAFCILGTEDFITESQVVLYPNPASDSFRLEFPSQYELMKVNLYTNLGQKVAETQERLVSLENLASGIYYVVIEFAEGTVEKRLIKG